MNLSAPPGVSDNHRKRQRQRKVGNDIPSSPVRSASRPSNIIASMPNGASGRVPSEDQATDLVDKAKQTREKAQGRARQQVFRKKASKVLSDLRAFHQRIVALVNEISDDAELGRRVRRYVQSEREGERRGEDGEDEGGAEAERARGP